MRLTTTIATASVAAVLGLAGVSVAGAASNGGSPQPAAAVTTAAPSPKAHAATAGANKPGARLRRRIRRGAGALIAKTIGITRPVLRQELVAGKTIAAIATEHGVQPQAVIDALTSAAHSKIDAAAAANKITPERAAKLKTRLDTAIPKLVNEWHPKAKH